MQGKGCSGRLTVREVERKLKNVGYTKVRQSGSHAVYKNGSRQMVVLPVGSSSNKKLSDNVIHEVEKILKGDSIYGGKVYYRI